MKILQDNTSSFMKAKHINFTTSLSGLVIELSLPYLGATPDGLASCDCCAWPANCGNQVSVQVQEYVS